MQKPSLAIFALVFMILSGCGGGGSAVTTGSGDQGPNMIVPGGALGSLSVTADLSPLAARKVLARAGVSSVYVAFLRGANGQFGVDLPESLTGDVLEVQINNVPLGPYQLIINIYSETGVLTGYVEQPITVNQGSQAAQVTVSPALGIGTGPGGSVETAGPPFQTVRAFANLDQNASPQSIVTGDFDRNDKPDVVMLANGQISLMRGRGAGDLEPPVLLSLLDRAEFLESGDFNGDGQTDLATAGGSLVVYFGANGPGQRVLRDGQPPLGLVKADLNGDSRDDLITWSQRSDNSSFQLTIALGDRSGPVALSPLNFDLGRQGREAKVVPGDYNGDGKVDLALVQPNQVALLINNNSLSFALGPSFSVPISAPDSRLAGAGDFDQDGRTDLVIGNKAGFFAVLYGSPSGLQPGAAVFSGMNGIRDLTIADFDGDNIDDVCLAGSDLDGTSLLLSNGSRSFEPPRRYFGDNAQRLAFEDFDQDGKIDLVGLGEASVSLYLTGTSDRFLLPVRLQVQPFNSAPVSQIRTADIDGDGKDDLAIQKFGVSLPVELFLGLGEGAFVTGQVYGGLSDIVNFLDVIDLTQDGILDLVIGSKLRLGSPGGNFAEEGLDIFPGVTQAGAFVDLDGDGLLDFAGATAGGLSVLLNRGNAQFEQLSLVTQGEALSHIISGDFNGDGDEDLAWIAGNTIVVALGEGDGTLGAPGVIARTPLSGTGSLVSGDFNQDGADDLAFGSFSESALASQVSVLLSVGNGSFAAPQNYLVDRPIAALAAVDIESDGPMDLIAAVSNSKELQVFRGSGSGQFARQPSLGVGLEPTSLASGDFNADGKPDFVVGGQGRLAVFLNR